MPIKVSDEEFISCWKRLGSPARISEALGIDVRQVYRRRAAIEEKHGFILDAADEAKSKRGRDKIVTPKLGYRALQENITGTVIVASDMHAWPGDRSVGFAALVELIKDLKPSLVIANGDSVDMASISRHPPIGWQSVPTVAEELDAAKELHAELEDAAPSGCPLIWTYGNHCLRFNSRLASEAPEFRGMAGASLEDHFPAWDFAMSVHLNGHTVIMHSWHNGVHSAYNNAVKSGVNTVTGHTHRLQAVQWADYNGLRWGIECGTLSDFGPDQSKFHYTLDRPVNWSQGFSVLTFNQGGMLLEPEFCRVLNGQAYFRGQNVINKIMPQTKRKQAA
jgi:hypothetical protein